MLHSKDLELRNVTTVILSHIHPDHITHAVRLNRLSKCRIVANEITAPLFNEKEKMKRFLGFHKGQPVRKLWEKLVDERMYGALDTGQVDEVLTDGEKFVLGDFTLQVLYTPGHLPDHMCLEILESRLLFGADIDLTEFGPFYGHPNSSIDDFKESIRRVQQREYDGLISGHLENPLVSNYRTALGGYYRQFELRDELVLSVIMGGAETLEEITLNPIIYPSIPSPVFLQFEKWMVEHHVSDLIAKGLVEETKGQLKAT
ncbi:MAG: MBL fold metallo-hydrolase [Candidatus Thorarchaeota archaeon]|jgi:glyoxylase-like metal-dependent hydrolase (beta-lactamase superfamily II)